MKKKTIITVLTVSVVLLFALGAIAGKGPGMAGAGGIQQGGGACLLSLYDGTPVTITGAVVSFRIPGSGLLIDTGDSIETVYGIGPYWYWEAKGIERPEIGEVVTVNAFKVEFSDAVRNIASSITVEGQTLTLRDSETGAPLWRGGRRNFTQ
jgi:hypothetical protein